MKILKFVRQNGEREMMQPLLFLLSLQKTYSC